MIIVSFFPTHALAENWLFYCRFYGIYDEYFIDLNSIRLVDKVNHIKNQIKTTACHLAYKHGKLKYSIGTYHYDCKNKKREHLYSTNTNRDNKQW